MRPLMQSNKEKINNIFHEDDPEFNATSVIMTSSNLELVVETLAGSQSLIYNTIQSIDPDLVPEDVFTELTDRYQSIWHDMNVLLINHETLNELSDREKRILLERLRENYLLLMNALTKLLTYSSLRDMVAFLEERLLVHKTYVPLFREAGKSGVRSTWGFLRKKRKALHIESSEFIQIFEGIPGALEIVGEDQSNLLKWVTVKASTPPLELQINSQIRTFANLLRKLDSRYVYLISKLKETRVKLNEASVELISVYK